MKSVWTTWDTASAGLPGLDRVLIWFNDPANWSGPTGLLARTGEHIAYAVIVVAAATAIAVPVGTWIGHTGRGVLLVAGGANALRAVPSLGLLILLIVEVSPRVHARGSLGPLLPRGSIPYAIPALVVLLVLAVPPILTNTYAGVQALNPATRDAASGAGMTGWQVARQVELPAALPLVVAGIRSAMLQVIGSLAVVAYAPLLGGLGRLIVDGDQNLSDLRYGYPAMVAAGITVALLAITIDLLLQVVERRIGPPGETRPRTTRRAFRSLADMTNPFPAPSPDPAPASATSQGSR